jgi:hypothetical protein
MVSATRAAASRCGGSTNSTQPVAMALKDMLAARAVADLGPGHAPFRLTGRTPRVPSCSIPDKMTAMAGPRPRRRWPAARPRPGRCRWRAAGVAGCRESWRPPVMVADVPPGITVTPGPHAASPGVPVRTGRLVCFCRIAQELTVTLPGRRYELAGRLMAQAITDARAGSSVTGSREQPEEIPGRRRVGKASGQVGSGGKTVPTGGEPPVARRLSAEGLAELGTLARSLRGRRPGLLFTALFFCDEFTQERSLSTRGGGIPRRRRGGRILPPVRSGRPGCGSSDRMR